MRNQPESRPNRSAADQQTDKQPQHIEAENPDVTIYLYKGDQLLLSTENLEENTDYRLVVNVASVSARSFLRGAEFTVTCYSPSSAITIHPPVSRQCMITAALEDTLDQTTNDISFRLKVGSVENKSSLGLFYIDFFNGSAHLTRHIFGKKINQAKT